MFFQTSTLYSTRLNKNRLPFRWPPWFFKKNGGGKIWGVIKKYQPKQWTLKRENASNLPYFCSVSFPPQSWSLEDLHYIFVASSVCFIRNVPWKHNQHQMVLKSIMPMYLCMYNICDTCFTPTKTNILNPKNWWFIDRCFSLSFRVYFQVPDFRNENYKIISTIGKQPDRSWSGTNV